MPHLISIISDQAVPNLLFIRQFARKDSEYFFVTTMDMEDRQATDHLMAALRLPKQKCHRILIDANDALLIFDQLKAFPFPNDADYLVNITGGNKLMSQMVFQHFMDYKSSMLYAPINSLDYQQLYPVIKSIPKDPTFKTSLDDYLRAYGFLAKSSLVYYEGNPKPENLMRQVIHQGHPAKVEAIMKPSRPADKRYLGGEWFELFCYKYFKEAFDLEVSQIACGVGVKRADSRTTFVHDNEFDLMFVHQNDLYVFECKVYTVGRVNMKKISQPMFKLASLSQNFGLKCKKFLAVLGEISQDPKSGQQLENLKRNLGISKILDMESFSGNPGKEILLEYKGFKINQL